MKGIKLFDKDEIRVEWDEERGEWYFSVVDVVAVLTDNDLHRLKAEGSEMVTNCNQLKMLASDCL